MSTLEEKIKTWLTTQGYPLEMRTAEVLRKAGIGADHHRVYTDPETGKVREIDLIGYLDYPPGLHVHLVFECKHSRDKPWILFCTAHRGLTEEGYVASMPMTLAARAAITPLEADPSVQRMTIFKAPPLTGFRLLRAHIDNQDAAYHAILGLAGACVATARDIGKNGHTVIYVPIVVVDSPLLECHLPPGCNDLEVTQVSHGLLLHTQTPGEHVVIHVVHIDSLPSFIDDVKADSAALNALVRRLSRGKPKGVAAPHRGRRQQ